MKSIGIGIIGAGWMGRAHAAAFVNAKLIFEDLPPVRIRVVADVDLESARTLALANSCDRWVTDWREVVDDATVDVVDINTPNNLHFPIAHTAIAAGKHVYCEKPLALSPVESEILVDVAQKAGIVTLVGFSYLKNPAQVLASELIQAGEIGEILSFRGIRDGDGLADPAAPFSWRHDRKIAGSGALGDTGIHALSLAQLLVGDVEAVFGCVKTFIKNRPTSASGSGYTSKADLSKTRAVENDDTALCMLKFKNGAIGSMSCSRIATGRQTWLTYEIQGTKGALYFTQQRMNELRIYRCSDAIRERGYKTVYIGPEHGIYSAFHAIPGLGLGENDLKVIEVRELLCAIKENKPAQPDFSFAHRLTQVIDAILISSEEGRWVTV